MPLHKLARELDETARQSAAMIDGISAALKKLSDPGLDRTGTQQAADMIVVALQGQDRIEQRCRNMAEAVRQFALLPPNAPQALFDEIWNSLALDELRAPGFSGAARQPQDEVELF